jgi:hypothetical protein
MTNRPRIHRHAVLKLLTSAACLAASAPSLAQQQEEESPYYIGVSQGFSRDSNVHRRATNETSDTISSTGVLAGINQRIGRQRLFADAEAEVNRYRNVTSFNNKSYSLLGGLDWETIETLAGTLRYNTRDSLSNFNAPDGSTLISDQRTQQFTATARYGLATQLMFDLGYDHRTLKVKSLTGRDYKQDAVNGGLRWAVGGKLTLGAGVRATKGKLETLPVADETDRRDIDLTATWATGGFSTFNARVSRTKEEHSLGTTADLSETTGALSWAYRPTGRLSMNATFSRDTGTETTFLASTSGGADALPVDNSRLSNTVTLDAQYELTGKISLNGNVRQRKGTFGNSQTETVKDYLIGVSYLPTRSVALRCNARREARTVSGANAYEVTVTGCTGELTLR